MTNAITNVDIQTCHQEEKVDSTWRWKEENCQNTKFIFFSGNEQLKIMILYIPILLLFLRI
jgi:hypothetical protein